MKDLDLELHPIIQLQLPWPPTVNNYYSVARGRKILSKAGRDFKRRCQLQGFEPLNLTQDISLFLYYVPPDKRRRDIDNLSKAVLDALTDNQVYKDDSQVKHLEMQMCGETCEYKTGFVFVEVSIIKQYQDPDLKKCKKSIKRIGNVLFAQFRDKDNGRDG